MLVKLLVPNNTTGGNVCKVSSVSQLIKPSTVSKSVLSNNVCSVCNVISISQLVKTINVTKSVFPLMQVILSFVIPLVSLFLILLVIVSQLNLLINLLI